MNERDIERMWKVASNNPHHDTNWHDPVVIAFAKLIRADEREACAKLCEGQADYGQNAYDAYDCATAIRARGNT